jgi:heterodisulfide reductase subunit A-like polyferredoxin
MKRFFALGGLAVTMMMHSNTLYANKLQVLIVGVGITGLSTAIALEKAGVSADLIEKRRIH